MATSGEGSAGSVSLNANTFSLTDGSQVVSSTDGAGQGGSVAIAAANSATISGSGSGLFSTASSTGKAGQITVSAPSLAPVPTLTIADNAKISVATTGTMKNAGDAGSIELNTNTLNRHRWGAGREQHGRRRSGRQCLQSAANTSTSISGSQSGICLARRQARATRARSA